VVYACNLEYLGNRGRKTESSRLAQAKLEKFYLKNKRTGDIAKVVECLPSKYKVLRFNH
jgi:hypothetical protein